MTMPLMTRLIRPNLEALSTPADTDSRFDKPARGWRRKLFTVIFEADTPAGLWFDLTLIAVIVMSVLVVILDSVQAIRDQWRPLFNALEWVFTILFTLEYIARLCCVNKPLRYALSFYGVIDLLALLPTFLVAFAPELAYLIDVRILRLLRVFRIFKLSRYSVEYRALVSAVASSRRKITVFVGFVMLVVLVMGTLIYVVEGPTHGFTSIPVAIYWAISTMATVGFGDLVPKTDLGRAIASVMMLVGWGVLAVPTGIVTAEMTRRNVDDDLAEPIALASRGVLALTAEPDSGKAPAKRLTPSARRRALAQHRRGAR